MPLPLIGILGAGAAIIGGTVAGARGGINTKKADSVMRKARSRHEKNVLRFEKESKITNAGMDKLGELELEILHSFGTFSDVFEQIKNRPVFEDYSKEKVTLPTYNREELKKISVGAGALLGGLGGAALGTAGGFAAAGATTAAVMVFGTASTGTAIASLSGAALTNATLAALGGGAIAAGGGGIALGTTVLSVTTFGVGLLVGGIIFNFTGKTLADKADKAYAQMEKAEKQIDKICEYFADLRAISSKYYGVLLTVNNVYQEHLDGLIRIVALPGHNDWNLFSEEEKELIENTVLLVGLLYNMCKVRLVLRSEQDETNKINYEEINEAIKNADVVLQMDLD